MARSAASKKKTSSASDRNPREGASAKTTGTRDRSDTRQGPLRAAGPAVALAGHLQRKPVVGRPGDRYEREADSVARRVASGQRAPSISRIGPGGLTARRASAEEDETVQSQTEEEEPVQTQSSDEEEEPVQMQSSDEEEESVQMPSSDEEEPVQAKTPGGGASSAAARALRGGGAGRAMHGPTRHVLQRRMGVDLDHVRVHEGPTARSSARAMNARAFTHGRDVYLGPGGSDRDVSLMAHEATHVVQQGGATRTPAGGAGSPVQRRGSGEEEETVQSRAFVQRSWLGDAWGAIKAGARAIKATAEEIGNWALDKVFSVLEEYLPAPAMAFIRDVREKGIIGALYAQIEGAVSGIFDTLADQGPTLKALVEAFRGFLDRAKTIITALISGDCEPLFQAIKDFKALLSDVAGKAWEKVTDFLEPVTDFLKDVWEKIGSPIVDWIEGAAGAVWGTLKSIWKHVKDLGSKIASVAKKIGSALWGRLKSLLGFGGGESDEGDGSGGIGAWIMEKAGAAWKKVTSVLEPIVAPMKKVVEKITALLPLDAITRMQEKVEQFQQNAGQMGEAGGSPDDVVKNQVRLREAILPAVLGAIETVRSVVGKAKSWIVSIIEGLSKPINSFFSTLESIPLLGKAAGALEWVRDGVSTLKSWAADTVGGLFDLVDRGLAKLKEFARPVYRTLLEVVQVLQDFVGSIKDLVVGAFWKQIPACIREVIRDFLIDKILANVPFFGKLVTVKDAWDKIVDTVYTALFQVFVDGDLLGAAWTVFQAMLRAIGLPPELVIALVNNALKAFTSIFGDPIGFLVNLVKSIQKGFTQFFFNFPTHLLGGLTDWLFGTLRKAGVEPPASLELSEILRFVMEVLGITLDKVVQKLADKIGVPKERIDRMIDRIEKVIEIAGKGLEWIQKLVTEGPGALWEWLKGKLSDLWQRVIDGITNWMVTRIIDRVLKRLALMLDPSGIGAVINIVVTIWNAIQSFVEYLKEMIQIVNSVFEGVTAIAKGVLGKAATYVESSLAQAIPVAIGFLARQAGLGDLSDRIKEMIEAVRGKVDEALTWLVGKTVDLVKKGLDLARRAVGAVTGKEKQEDRAKTEAGRVVREAMTKGIRKSDLEALLKKLERDKNLKRAELTSGDDVVLENSPAETFEGRREQKLRVGRDQEGRAVEKAQRGALEKGSENVLELGDLQTSASNSYTIRGALRPHFEVMGISDDQFPYPDVPHRAPKPDKVKATLTGMYQDPDEDTALPSGQRDSDTTRLVGNLGDVEARVFKERTGYEGGHLVGHQFGGPDTYENLVPQRGNEINRGAYKSMESFVAKNLKEVGRANRSAVKASVEVTVWPRYTSRPSITLRQAARGLVGELGKQVGQLQYKGAVTEEGITRKIPVGVDQLTNVNAATFAAAGMEGVTHFKRTETDEKLNAPVRWQITTDRAVYIAEYDGEAGVIELYRSRKSEQFVTAKEMEGKAAGLDRAITLSSRIPTTTRAEVRVEGLTVGAYSPYTPPEKYQSSSDDTDTPTLSHDYLIYLEGEKPVSGSTREKGSTGADLSAGKEKKGAQKTVTATDTFTIQG